MPNEILITDTLRLQSTLMYDFGYNISSSVTKKCIDCQKEQLIRKRGMRSKSTKKGWLQFANHT